MKPRKSLGRLAVSTLICAMFGCGPSGSTGPVRQLPTIPERQFHSSDHLLDEALHWQFATESDLAPWSIRASVGSEWSDGALRLAAAETASLTRSTEIEASDVASLVVVIEGLRMGRVRLSWAPAGGDFSPDRSITVTGDGGLESSFEFPVAEHPEWSGVIARIGLEITGNPGEWIGVRSITGIRANPGLDPSELGQPWRFEIDDESRAGLAVSPDRPGRWTLRQDGELVLHFAVGLLHAPSRGDARFSITRIDGDSPVEISALSVDGDEVLRWIPATAHLPKGSDEEVGLELRLDCPPTDRCLGAVVSLEARPREREDRPNIVLISVDTLRADRMSLYGNPRPTTERIDRWARDIGIVFEQAVAASPWTLPSHMSILTGLNPTTHGVNYQDSRSNDLDMLAERLRKRGYFTAAVTGGGFMAPEFGFWQGFDVYRSWQRDVSRYWSDESAPDEEIASGVSRARELLQEAGDRPVFLLLHTYQVHGPYRRHAPYFQRFFEGPAPDPTLAVGSQRLPLDEEDGFKVRRRLMRMPVDADPEPLPPDELPLALALYDSGIAAMDREIGRLLEELENTGRMDDTIVVLTSDHGEMLGERGLGGHAYLHDPNLLVPLVISWPDGFDGADRIGRQVRSVDLLPTLLDLIGEDVAESVDGVSLTPLLEDATRAPAIPPAMSYAASSNHGLSLRIDGRLKYVYDNSPWRTGPLGTVETIGSRNAPAPSDEEMESLRGTAEKLLTARDGLHMLLAARESDELRLRLTGPMVRRNRLKAIGLECHCSNWLGGSSAEIRVPPGNRFGLQIENPGTGVLTVELRRDDAVYRREIDLEALREPLSVRLVRGEWIEAIPGSPDLESGLFLWWQGRIPLTSDDPMDEDVARELRALGYLQ